MKKISGLQENTQGIVFHFLALVLTALLEYANTTPSSYSFSLFT